MSAGERLWATTKALAAPFGALAVIQVVFADEALPLPAWPLPVGGWDQVALVMTAIALLGLAVTGLRFAWAVLAYSFAAAAGRTDDHVAVRTPKSQRATRGDRTEGFVPAPGRGVL